MLVAVLKLLASAAVADGDSNDSDDDGVLLSTGWCFAVAAVSIKHLY
jgi:hypothetical protein